MSEQDAKESLQLTYTVRGEFLHESVEVEYINNTGQTILTISSDRLELRARDFSENIKKRTAWVGSLGLAVSTFTTLMTTTFHNVMGFSAEVIRFCFLLMCILSVCHSVYKLGGVVIKKEDQAYTPKEFVELCKKRSQPEKKK